jgi:biopolymer transport protein ExbD
MAAKRQFFDVWIIETNTVYKEVPFLVITDWVQQGRLLAEDKVRQAGTEKWQTLESLAEFKPYLPKVEPYRVEDQAEALESVQVDFGWEPRSGAEDEDVDMIPLIDVSLVLLIFFMLTAAVGSASSILTPEAEYKLLHADDPRMLWITMDRNPGTGEATYALGEKDEATGKEDRTSCASKEDLLQKLEQRLQNESSPRDLRVQASKDLPCDLIIQDLNLDLEKLKARSKLGRVYTEVSEKKAP